MSMVIIGNKIHDILPIKKDGTNGRDINQASDQLQYLRRSNINQSNGPVGLDVSGNISSIVIP